MKFFYQYDLFFINNLLIPANIQLLLKLAQILLYNLSSTK